MKHLSRRALLLSVLAAPLAPMLPGILPMRKRIINIPMRHIYCRIRITQEAMDDWKRHRDAGLKYNLFTESWSR